MPAPPGLAPDSENPLNGGEGRPMIPAATSGVLTVNSRSKPRGDWGVNVAAKHRQARDLQVQQDRDTNIKKARWDPEEKRLLAEWEARLTRRGSGFTNADLLERLPHRTLEAIKGQRRKPEHRTLVQDLLQAPTPTIPPVLQVRLTLRIPLPSQTPSHLQRGLRRERHPGGSPSSNSSKPCDNLATPRCRSGALT